MKINKNIITVIVLLSMSNVITMNVIRTKLKSKGIVDVIKSLFSRKEFLSSMYRMNQEYNLIIKTDKQKLSKIKNSLQQLKNKLEELETDKLNIGHIGETMTHCLNKIEKKTKTTDLNSFLSPDIMESLKNNTYLTNIEKNIDSTKKDIESNEKDVRELENKIKQLEEINNALIDKYNIEFATIKTELEKKST
jgi:hypothetical protein